MNKHTVRQLVKRAYEARRSKLGGRWGFRREIEDTAEVKYLNAKIQQLTKKRDAIVEAFVAPKVKEAERQAEQLKKSYQEVEAALGFAITPEERAAATLKAKKFLQSIPDCAEAKLIR